MLRPCRSFDINSQSYESIMHAPIWSRTTSRVLSPLTRRDPLVIYPPTQRYVYPSLLCSTYNIYHLIMHFLEQCQLDIFSGSDTSSTLKSDVSYLQISGIFFANHIYNIVSTSMMHLQLQLLHPGLGPGVDIQRIRQQLSWSKPMYMLAGL